MLQPRTRRSSLLTLIMLPVLVLMGAACGDEDDGGEAGAETETTQSSATTTSAPAPVAAVRFAEPADGATVTAPVKVRMEATNFTIEPAGEVKAGSGHFHIMVDKECIAAGEIIPKDDLHQHYGMAQTEAELALAPGSHTLCLQVGDGAHRAIDLTDTIAVEVSG